MRFKGVDSIIRNEGPLSAEADNFTSRPEAGIHSQNRLFSKGRRDEELTHVLGEHPDGFLIRLFLAQRPELRFHGRPHETAV